MARPRTIDIDPGKLLAGIVAAYQHDVDTLQADLRAADEALTESRSFHAQQHRHTIHRELERLERDGCVYDIGRFLGRLPTPSERIVSQRRIRELAEAGLVEIDGPPARHAKPCERQINAACRRAKRAAAREIILPPQAKL